MNLSARFTPEPKSRRPGMAPLLVFILAICLHYLSASSAYAGRSTLIDFGADAGSTLTPHGDWNQILRDATATEFVDPDGNPSHDGVKLIDAMPEGASAWFGVMGSTPIDFRFGEKIIATFYNPTGQDQDLNLRLSVTDPDAPDPADASRPWLTMYAINYEGRYDSWISAPAGGFVEAELYITDSARGTATNAGVTAGPHSLVNINIANNNTEMILTRIELSDETDTVPPDAPSNLTASMITTAANAGSTVVRLTWSPSTDPGADASGIRGYLIYRDGELYDAVIDYPVSILSDQGSTPYYRDMMVEPGGAHRYHVTAMDYAPVGVYPTIEHMNVRHGNESSPSNTVNVAIPAWQSTTLINPYTDIVYQGAFRLPDDGSGNNWEYAHRGLTFYPDGNPGHDEVNELPGSLYAVNGSPHGNNIAEFSIPKPVQSGNTDDLPRADYLQPLVDLWPSVYSGSTTPAGGTDVKSLGIGYHPAVDGVDGQIYYTVSNLYSTDPAAPCVGAFDPDLTVGRGAWSLGAPPDNVHPGLVSAIVFSAPSDWANQYTGGRSLIVGNTYISGSGVPSAGPSLYAIAPWEGGALPAEGAALSYVELLRYDSRLPSESWGLNFSWDEFGDGAAWLVDGGRSAVAIASLRSIGDWWYGYMSGDNLCTYNIPAADTDWHGTGATDWGKRLMFYDPADLAAVARGQKDSWEPQPYASFDLTQFLIHAYGRVESGSLAYDQANGYLYFIDHNGDPGYEFGYSLIHVWKLDPEPVNNTAPVLDIKANGSDGPIAVSSGASVSFTLGLSAGADVGQNADWWLVEANPEEGLKHFDIGTFSFTRGVGFFYQGGLQSFENLPLPPQGNLAVGAHDFYFAVDTNMNGVPDLDQLHYDSVRVDVNP